MTSRVVHGFYRKRHIVESGGKSYVYSYYRARSYQWRNIPSNLIFLTLAKIGDKARKTSNFICVHRVVSFTIPILFV